METKITTRNFFESLITLATEGALTFTDAEGNVVEITAEELKAWAEKNIAQLDKRNETARARTEKKKAEGDALLELVYDAVSADEFETIADIAARVDAEDMSVAKVQARLATLLKADRVVKDTVKVEGSKGPRVAYKRA